MKRAGAMPLVMVLVAACGGRAAPTPVPHPMPTSIVASESGTCISFADQPPTCWGPIAFPPPALARRLAEAPDAIDIALGSDTACAVRPDGRVSCWGDPGQAPDLKVAPLADVAGVTDARAVRVASSFACALRATGVVTCWGLLVGTGDPPTDLRQLPSAIVELSLGWLFGCVRTANGAVQCWGSDYSGELGDGRSTTMFRYEPVAPLGLPAAAAIATGKSWACALLTTADVWCWGETPTRVPAPSSVPGLSDVEQLAVGATSACAVRRDGSVACWGMNEGGEVGYEQMSFTTPVAVRGLPPASLVAVGGTYACAVARDGDVWCWGTSLTGNLGTGQIEKRTPPLRVAL